MRFSSEPPYMSLRWLLMGLEIDAADSQARHESQSHKSLPAGLAGSSRKGFYNVIRFPLL